MFTLGILKVVLSLRLRKISYIVVPNAKISDVIIDMLGGGLYILTLICHTWKTDLILRTYTKRPATRVCRPLLIAYPTRRMFGRFGWGNLQSASVVTGLLLDGLFCVVEDIKAML